MNMGPKEVDLGSNHLITVDLKKGNSDHAGAATLYYRHATLQA